MWDPSLSECDNSQSGIRGQTTNALAAPAGTPKETSVLLTTAAGGVSPVFVGLWGAVDLIRDPFSDAQSGGLR
ncbi:hypothetical protein B5V46_06945 [Rhodovulum sp. MB263]|nr:hypothetical protein B5V46_06945 [Rhodovulum sp. MB263]